MQAKAEMATVDIEVGGNGNFFAGTGTQQGAIVADTESDGGASTGTAADLPH
jgi:hypothetical protein